MSDTDQLKLPANVESLRESIFSAIHKAIMDRRLEGRCTPKRTNGSLEDYDGIKYSKKELDLICLLLICRFCSIFDGFEGYILYEINQHLLKNRLFPIIAAAIQAEDVFLEILLIFYEKKCSPEKLFRGILNPDRIEKIIETTRLRILHHRRPKRPIRRRGYNDHGSRRPDDRWLPDSDSTFVEGQQLLEQQRREYQELVDRLIQATRDLVTRKTI